MQNYGSVEQIWQMLIYKVSIAGKRTINFLDPFFVTYFDGGKIIQDKLDRLSNHSSLGNAIATIVNFSAALLKSAVAVECFYHFRPYYWEIMTIFYYLVYVIARGIFEVMVASLKWIVIMTLCLTSKIFVGLTTIFVFAFSCLQAIALPVLNGIVCVLTGLCLIYTGTVLLCWMKSTNRGHSSSSNGTAVLPDSPASSSSRPMPYRWQYKKSDSHRWNNFGHIADVAIEKLFRVLNDTSSLSDLVMGEAMDFKRITVDRDNRRFQTVFKLFHSTISESKASILMVWRIKNHFLRERYNRKREHMKKKLKASNYDKIEKLLFHGTTPDVIDAICKQNFDHRMRGKNGTRYGKGSYFAVKASYSNKYSNQDGEKTRFMFLASVLTGEYKLGGGELLRPPLKDPNNPASDLYDSCVDNEEEPNIFVIFNDEQCYPSYLIKYCLK